MEKKTLIFDIETVGESFDEMDELTKYECTKSLRARASSDEEFEAMVEEAKGRTALSPLTGEIVALGVMDVDDSTGAVYYQSPGVEEEDDAVGGIKLVAMGEKEMLEKFWEVAARVGVVAGFNSRSFDAWWLNVRSAVHGIRPSVDLLGGRYLYQQRGVTHVDLKDQLEYYGMARGGSLHMWCRAFGIDSPKANGMGGGEVGQAFAEGRYKDIARYNVDDLIAEGELYLRWKEFMNFQQL
jgi:hypothetical protein